MDVLFYLENFILSLQVHADRDIQRLVLVCQRVVVGVLYVTASKLVPLVNVDIVLHKVFVKILYLKVLSLKVNNRTLSTFLVNQHDRTDTSLLGHKGIVGTEVRGNMYDTSTIVGGYIVTGNHLEGITHRLNGRHQLLVLHSNEVCTLIACYDSVWNQLGASPHHR